MPDAGWYKGVDDAIEALRGLNSWHFDSSARDDVFDELKELRERGPAVRPEPTYEEAWKDEKALREKVPNGSKWRHIKRGTEYDIVDLAMLQDATGSGEHDMAIVVVYFSLVRGSLCVRPVAEFLDGRFARIE